MRKTVRMKMKRRMKEMKIKNYRDHYNSLKWWQVKRDKNYHYYLQQFIGVCPSNWRASSKMFRVRKSWIEQVIGECVFM